MQSKWYFFQNTLLTLYQNELAFGTWLIKANHYLWQISLTGESCLSCPLVDLSWLSQCPFPFLMFLFYILGEISIFLILYHLISPCSKTSLTNYLQFHLESPLLTWHGIQPGISSCNSCLAFSKLLESFPFLSPCRQRHFRISSP